MQVGMRLYKSARLSERRKGKIEESKPGLMVGRQDETGREDLRI